MPEETKKEQQPSSQAGEKENVDEGVKDPIKVKENKDVEYYKKEAESLKKEIEERNEQIKKAEHTIVDLKRKKTEEEAPIEDNKLDELEQKFERRFQQVQKLNAEERARELAVSMTKSSEEAELLLLTYKQRIVPSGDLKKDMNNAYSIVNGRRMQEEMQEKERAQRAQGNAGVAGNASQQNYIPPQAQTNYDDQTRKFIRERGVKLNPKTGKAVSPAREKCQKKMKEQFPNVDFTPPK